MKILIVEDEAILAMNTQSILLSMGHEVVGIADNGVYAMELVKDKMPDLILMDITLKGSMDGIETTALIYAKYPECRIIFVTAHTDALTVEKVNSTKHMGIIHKPVEPYKLIETITHLTA